MKPRKFKKFLLKGFALGMCLTPWAVTYAAQQETLWGNNVTDYMPLLRNFSLTQPLTIQNGLRLPSNLSAKTVGVNSFKYKSGNIDYAKSSHVRYNQYYKGLPVWGNEVIYHISAKNETTVTGSLLNGIEKDVPDIAGKLSIDQIKMIALKNNPVTTPVNAEKIIFFNADISSRAILAYRVSYASHTPAGLALPTFIIDANTGKILQDWDALPTFENGQGVGGVLGKKEYLYGYEDLMETSSLGFLDLNYATSSECVISNDQFKVYNLKNLEEGQLPGQLGYRTPVSTAIENTLAPFRFYCMAPNINDNGWSPVNNGRSPINDVTYFIKQTFYMLAEYGVTAPVGTQLPLRIYTHIANYDNAYACDNACMKALQVNGPAQLVFGNGATQFAPLTEGDVVAHEFGHLVTGNFSNLIYINESGGMNEAFSDMTGVAMNNYMRSEGYTWYWSGKDWTMGTSISKTGRPMRYFDEPTKDGISISKASDFKPGMNTHFSSGVYNKAFYLLSTTKGWRVDKAYRIMLDANMTRWTSESTFITGACSVAQAAASRGYSVKDVKAAFTKVGINIPAACKV